jgi:tetratricopeptide (TPR) repeat protein
MATSEPDSTPPKAFISYSWEDDAHKEWVRQLAIRLRKDGVNVTLDRWHAAPGDQIPAFMERAVRENDLVIAVCTPKFKNRSDGRGGGVGYEGDIMTAYALKGGDERRFIPVLRRGSWDEAAPAWLLGRAYIDLSTDPYSESEYEELLRTLHGAREEAPQIGPRPDFRDKKGSRASPAPAPASRSSRSSLLGSVAKIGSVAALLVAGFAVWNRRLDTLRSPGPVPGPPLVTGKEVSPRIKRTTKATRPYLSEAKSGVGPRIPEPGIQVLSEATRPYLSEAKSGVGPRIPEPGIQVLSEATPENPSDAEKHFEQGNAEFARGQYERAITEYTEAIRLNPTDAAAYNNRGSSHSKLGAYDPAISDYDEAIRLDPENPDFYSNRGNAYAHLGYHSLGKADYAKADSLRSKAMKLQKGDVINP